MSEEFEEIKYLTQQRKPKIEGKCPRCGGGLVFDSIPCPEQKEGCLVAHYGYICLDCARCFQKKRNQKSM